MSGAACAGVSSPAALGVTLAAGGAGVIVGVFGRQLCERRRRFRKVQDDTPEVTFAPEETEWKVPVDEQTQQVEAKHTQQVEGKQTQQVEAVSRHSRAKHSKHWDLRERVEADSPSAVRIRFIHINDVYTLEHLPKFYTMLSEFRKGLPEQNVVVSIGGDFLAPYPLSALDSGKGMVEVLRQCGVRIAIFGNHEADVNTHALQERIEEWRRDGGTWLNTNMRDVLPNMGLPPNASVVAYSSDGHVSKEVALLGVCTEDPCLYVPPDDFAGAIQSAENPNECALTKAKELWSDVKPPDTVVVLTHQDTDPDRDLASKARGHGISLILGGHDHEEYLEWHDGCVMAKSGMDAQKAVVVDLVWPTPETKLPQVGFAELVPLTGYSPSKAVARSVDRHMQKVWDMERLKGATALIYLDEVKSSKGIREYQTSMGHFLCEMLRDELEADVVLLDGGNIRGARDYIPVPGHRRGSRWAFTLSDLEAELPWPSEIVQVVMKGWEVAEAIRYSRSKLPEKFGGFLQTDNGVLTVEDDQAKVTHLRFEPLIPDRPYRVALMQASLAGMNSNPVFQAWRERPGNILPSEDAGRPVKVLLLAQFARRTWNCLPDFAEINTSGSGHICFEELREAYVRTFPQECEVARDDSGLNAAVHRLMSMAESVAGRGVIYDDYVRLFPIPAYVTLTHFRAEQQISSKDSHLRPTTMGQLLCSAVREQLDVDCALLPGGDIRGNRDYIPIPGHERARSCGNIWEFTRRDLQRELPWKEFIVMVSMTGEELAAAVRLSRCKDAEVGAFLQADSGVQASTCDHSIIERVAWEPLDRQREYTVALPHSLLQGRHKNPVFHAVRTLAVLEPKGRARSAEVIVQRHFLQLLWLRMPSFEEMDQHSRGYLTATELRSAAVQVFGQQSRLKRSAIVTRLLLAADLGNGARVSKEDYERVVRRRELSCKRDSNLAGAAHMISHGHVAWV